MMRVPLLASLRLILTLAALASPASTQNLDCRNRCRGGNLRCVGDASMQNVADEDCAQCVKSSAKWTWPCSVEGLCWCWDSSQPRFKPAPASGLEPAAARPCDVFTEDMFAALAPNAIHPYTYAGLCDLIDEFNEKYGERAFGMGTSLQQRHEWAAFLGHTTHESAQYTAARENLVCARTVEKYAGTYCKPCRNADFDWDNMYCEVSAVANGNFYEDYCDKTQTPPFGCACGPTSEVDRDEHRGLINPNFAFFGRGALQLSWNTNYLQASKVLAGSSETLCSQPELVATDPKYAWGTALWFWLFNKPPGEETTCHIQSLEGSFGGSLNIINGGLECPAEPGSYHVEAIVTRLRYYCIAARVMRLRRLLDLGGCEGLRQSFENCVMTGYCPECTDFYVEETPAPSKAPSPPTPTAAPVGFRSWANDSWMASIKRRDSSARRNAGSWGLLALLAVPYIGLR